MTHPCGSGTPARLSSDYTSLCHPGGTHGSRCDRESGPGRAGLSAYYERTLDVFENRQAKRHANVLFWIALLQFVATYEGVGAYFGFLNLSRVDTESIFDTPAVAVAVIASPILLTAISIYAAYLCFKDDGGPLLLPSLRTRPGERRDRA